MRLFFSLRTNPTATEVLTSTSIPTSDLADMESEEEEDPNVITIKVQSTGHRNNAREYKVIKVGIFYQSRFSDRVGIFYQSRFSDTVMDFLENCCFGFHECLYLKVYYQVSVVALSRYLVFQDTSSRSFYISS